MAEEPAKTKEQRNVPGASKGTFRRGTPATLKSRGRNIFGAVGVLFFLALFLYILDLPYYAMGPGPTRHVDDLIQISGLDSGLHESEGKFLLTTVSLKPVNGYDWIASYFDSDQILLDRDQVIGGRTSEEFERDNALDMVISKEKASTAALFCTGVPLQGKGIRVEGIDSTSPVRTLLWPGDVIVSVEGEQVVVPSELIKRLQGKKVGETVNVEVNRNGVLLERELEFYHPETSDHPILGIRLGAVEVELETDLEIDIVTDNIGGPSAGLVYALTILDLLLPEDLTGGRIVAVTGTIDEIGKVGPIGGVEQKARGVARDGAELFIVPQENLEEAKKSEVDIEIVGVGTLNEALDALDVAFSCSPSALPE